MMSPLFEKLDQEFGNFSGDRHRENRSEDAQGDENQDVSLELSVDGENPDAWRQEKEGETLEEKVGHFRDLIDLDDFRTK